MIFWLRTNSTRSDVQVRHDLRAAQDRPASSFSEEKSPVAARCLPDREQLEGRLPRKPRRALAKPEASTWVPSRDDRGRLHHQHHRPRGSARPVQDASRDEEALTRAEFHGSSLEV
jgi:hypothetical protein